MTNEILTNATAAVNTEKKMTLAEKIAAKAAERYAEANEGREVVRELRKENFQNNTSIYAVVTNVIGYYGFLGTTPAEEDIADPITRKSMFKDGTRMSTQMSALAGAAYAIQDAMTKYPDRKKVSIYVQESEVSRLGGFINKAKKSSSEALTEGELNFISRTRGYGQPYVDIAVKTYQMVLLAHQKGYTLQFNGFSAIEDYQTVRITDSKIVKGVKSAIFKNGTATVNGHLIALKDRINGTFDLVDQNGRVAVKRKLTEEQAIAQGLKSYVDATLKVMASNEQVDSLSGTSAA
jgi:hypothetical protein